MAFIDELKNRYGDLGAATSQTPSIISGGGDTSSFSPGKMPFLNELQQKYGVVNTGGKTQPPQQQSQQPPQRPPQEIIQAGIQQPQQRVVPGQDVDASGHNILVRAATKIGNFFNLGKAVDIVDRSLSEGAVGQTRQSIMDNAVGQVELMKNLLDNEQDPAKKSRIENRLARYIEDTNDILGDDVFQAPTTLQKVGAAATIGTAVIPAFRGGQLFTAPGKGLLARSVPFGVEGGLFGAGSVAMETGDLEETIKGGAIGAGIGAAIPGALSLAGKGISRAAAKPLSALENPMSAKTEAGRAVARFFAPVANVIKSTGAKGAELYNKLENIRIDRDLFIGKAEKGLQDFGSIYNKLTPEQADEAWAILEKNSRLNPDLVNPVTKSRIRPNYTGEELATFTNDPAVKEVVRRAEPITKELSEMQIQTGEHAGRSFRGRPGDAVEEAIVPQGQTQAQVPVSKPLLPEGKVTILGEGDNRLDELLTSNGYKNSDIPAIMGEVDSALKVQGIKIGLGTEVDSSTMKPILDDILNKYQRIGEKAAAATPVAPAAPVAKVAPKEAVYAVKTGDKKGVFNIVDEKGKVIKSFKTKTEAQKELNKIKKIAENIKKNGGVFRGLQEVPDGKPLVLFDDPKTGTTLALETTKLTPKNIAKEIADSRVKFGVKEEGASKILVTKEPLKGATVKNVSGAPVDVTIPTGTGPFAPHIRTEIAESGALPDISSRVERIMRENKTISKIPDPILKEAKARELAEQEMKRLIGPGPGKLRDKFYASAAEARADGVETNLVRAYEGVIRRDANVAAQLKNLGFDNITGKEDATTEEIAQAQWTKLLAEVRKELEGATGGKISEKEAYKVTSLIRDNIDFFLHGGDFNQLIVTAKKLNALKLGLAPIANMTQSINALLKADLPYVWAGTKSALRGFKGEIGETLGKEGIKTGKELAERAGVTRASVLDDWLQGEERTLLDKALDKYLKLFKWTEQGLNRPIATNVGAQMAFGLQRTVNTANDPKIVQTALKRLEEMLGKKISINKSGQIKLTVDDLLRAGNRFSKETQFGANPLEQPWWANTEFGTIFWQFKTFIYQQTRLLANATIGELQAGNPGRAARNFGILATMYPMSGTTIGAIKNIITGKENNYDLWTLDGYLNSIGQVGGLGMAQDVLESALRSPSGLITFFGGPTAGTISSVGYSAAKGLQNMTEGEVPFDQANEIARNIFGGAWRVPENIVENVF